MPRVMVCPACDLAHRAAVPPLHGKLECVRCRASLLRPDRVPIERAIAVALCALVLLVLTNAYPLVEMQVSGATRATTLAGAAYGLYAQGFRAVAALVFLTTVIAPALQIAALLYVLIPLRRGRRAQHQKTAIRVLTQVRGWTFVEVFMLGSLVALVRLAKFAAIVPGVSLWACALLMMSLAALMSIATPEQLWRWVEEQRR
jgi:paraquat-inducible protein A